MITRMLTVSAEVLKHHKTRLTGEFQHSILADMKEQKNQHDIHILSCILNIWLSADILNCFYFFVAFNSR